MEPGRRIGPVQAAGVFGRGLADGQDQIAARHHGLGEGRRDPPGGGRVQEVQDRDQQHAHGLGQIDEAGQRRIPQERPRIPQVTGQGDDAGVERHEAACVRDHHRVVVHVGDPGPRQHRAGGLMRARAGGQAGADIDELGDILAGHVRDRAGQERPVLPGQLRQPRVRGQQPGRLIPVGGEVRAAPEQVVIDAGDVRLGGVGRRHGLLQLGPQPFQARGGHHPGIRLAVERLGDVGVAAPHRLAPDHEAGEISLERLDVAEHAQLPVHQFALPSDLVG